MKVTLHQPEHLPWLGFLHKMAEADLYVYADNVQYRHQYFQNRNRIRGVHAPIWVTVPVLRRGYRDAAINEVVIDESRDWRTPYWGSIVHHYGKHPYFKAYADRMHALIATRHERLVDMNYAWIGLFREAFGIHTPTMRASDMPKVGAKTSYIHAVCAQVGAKTYLSGPTGRAYLDEAPFEAAGIQVQYHAFNHPRYAQKGREHFTPGLSALDLLMEQGPQGRRILLPSELKVVSEQPLWLPTAA